MSSSARILKFPRRALEIPSSEEALQQAQEFLKTDIGERPPEAWEALISQPDALFALCRALQDQAEVSPALVATEAARLYESISRTAATVGLFDEKRYLMGEAALLAGRSFRHLGKRDDAERWLDRAEAAFRHTVNPGPPLASVSYARLALRYDSHRHEDVLELLPSLLESFEQFGMKQEAAKCRFLEAMTWKELGQSEKSMEILSTLRTDSGAAEQPGLLGQVFTDIGEYHSSLGRYAEAMDSYKQAIGQLTAANRPIAVAHLKWSLADLFARQGLGDATLDAYRAAQADFSALGMSTYSVSVHLATADHLLTMSRPREAEWEILAALPTIEEQKMVPEGFAAVALLKESVRRRKTDPNALRELREHLQAAKK